MTPRQLITRFSKDFDPKWLRMIHAEMKPGNAKKQVAHAATKLEKAILGFTSQRQLNRNRNRQAPHEKLASWMTYTLRRARSLLGLLDQSREERQVIRKRAMSVAAKICKAEREPVDEHVIDGTVIDLVKASKTNKAVLPILADALMDAGCDDGRILDAVRGGRLPERLLIAFNNMKGE